MTSVKTTITVRFDVATDTHGTVRGSLLPGWTITIAPNIATFLRAVSFKPFTLKDERGNAYRGIYASEHKAYVLNTDFSSDVVLRNISGHTITYSLEYFKKEPLSFQEKMWIFILYFSEVMALPAALLLIPFATIVAHLSPVLILPILLVSLLVTQIIWKQITVSEDDSRFGQY